MSTVVLEQLQQVCTRLESKGGNRCGQTFYLPDKKKERGERRGEIQAAEAVREEQALSGGGGVVQRRKTHAWRGQCGPRATSQVDPPVPGQPGKVCRSSLDQILLLSHSNTHPLMHVLLLHLARVSSSMPIFIYIFDRHALTLNCVRGWCPKYGIPSTPLVMTLSNGLRLERISQKCVLFFLFLFVLISRASCFFVFFILFKSIKSIKLDITQSRYCVLS